MKAIFKNKITLIISLIVLCIIIVISAFYFIVFSSLKLVGNSNVNINYGEKYKEEGATFKIFGTDLNKNINIKDNINNKKLGKYKVTYSVKYLFFHAKKERTVNVVDNIAPVINLKGDSTVSVCPNSYYNEEGYEAIDEYDGNITDKVKKIITDDGNILYEVVDPSGNKSNVERIINEEDKEAPVIKLRGSSTVYIKVNSKYDDPGYDLLDNCDLEPKVEISNNLNTSKPGNYTVQYNAVDSSGNTSFIIRNVVVYDDNKTGVIYLTFDDGPSDNGSTSKILDILKSEGVHATFFVTNRGSDNLIKREYDEGHTVALHTSTHDYSYIYSSVNNYFNDLNSVQNRVYNITGYKPEIIRFAGGSNNTVSNRYNSGIMDILTKEVLNRGYSYFDWNVSSGDAGECSTSDCVYNNVVKNLSKSRINIILMHDTKMFTANALKDIIFYAKINGYVFKVIDKNTYPIRFK